MICIDILYFLESGWSHDSQYALYLLGQKQNIEFEAQLVLHQRGRQLWVGRVDVPEQAGQLLAEKLCEHSNVSKDEGQLIVNSVGVHCDPEIENLLFF